MPLTKKQLEARRHALGSSDAAAALGVSPWKNPHDLWLEKLGKLKPEPENVAMKMGNYFEDGVLQWVEDELGVRPKRNQPRRHPDYPWWRANLDGLLTIDGKPVPVDAKFCAESDEWGPEGSDIIPMEHMVQGYHQSACVGAERFYIAASLFGSFGKRRFTLYEVPIRPATLEAITEGLRAFWACVEQERPPETAPVASLETAKRIIRTPGAWGVVPSEVIQRYEAAKAAIKEAQAHKDEAEAELLTLLGDAEVAVYTDADDGGRKALWYREEPMGRRVDSSSLRKRFPDAWEACSSDGTRRVWRPKSLLDLGIEDAAVVAALNG